MNKLTIEEVHSAILGAMKDIDRVCKEHGIQYMALAGTMLGAVRHKGYIPWDDDIDIGIKREDYYKFLEIYEQYRNPRYEIFEYSQRDDFYNQFAKISDSKTRIIDDWGKVTPGLGVAVDIFPIDYVSSKNIKLKNKYMLFLIKQLHLSLGSPSGRKGVTLLKKIARPIIAPRNFKYYLQKIDKFATRENDSPDADLAGAFSTGVGMPMLCERRVYDSLVDLDFEDMKLTTVKDYDHYLTHMYGDYMQLPKEEDRIAHLATSYWVEE
ncbi:MAG: phosphorylcholine transferase LicD [Eubacterium sp.]